MKCRELQRRIEELEAENKLLRSKLGMAEAVASAAPVREENTPQVLATAVHKRSSTDDKIRLFRSLFRGREDVFARRWYSTKKEKGGYAPVCANEWRDGVCIKPKGSCSKCEHRELVALSDKVLYDHLSGSDPYGRDVIGIYPILPDDTCYFLAIDFDDDGWQENVLAVRRVCEEWKIPCGVERSRSGKGAHLWIFFSAAVSCTGARKLGSALLTAAMEREGKLKLDAYDRMFPCQDMLPNGGFGNLIALPLQAAGVSALCGAGPADGVVWRHQFPGLREGGQWHHAPVQPGIGEGTACPDRPFSQAGTTGSAGCLILVFVCATGRQGVLLFDE